jgi:hypothetical protein
VEREAEQAAVTCESGGCDRVDRESRRQATTRAERRPRADGGDLRWKDVRGGAAWLVVRKGAASGGGRPIEV